MLLMCRGLYILHQTFKKLFLIQFSQHINTITIFGKKTFIFSSDIDTDNLDTDDVEEEIVEFLVKEETTVLE